MKSYSFLTEMYSDAYFPDHLIDKCKQVLIALCEDIERHKPADLSQVFMLTRSAVESINRLEPEFEESESELETVAREALAADFGAILDAYGFEVADLDDAIGNRDW